MKEKIKSLDFSQTHFSTDEETCAVCGKPILADCERCAEILPRNERGKRAPIKVHPGCISSEQIYKPKNTFCY